MNDTKSKSRLCATRACLFAVSLFYLVTISLAHAQTGGFVPLQSLSDSRLSGLYTAGNLTDYINNMFLFMIAIGAMLAVGRLAYAGWLYMLGDNSGNLKNAKTIIGDVIIGLLLLLSIWLILNLINPEILNLNVLKILSA